MAHGRPASHKKVQFPKRIANVKAFFSYYFPFFPEQQKDNRIQSGVSKHQVWGWSWVRIPAGINLKGSRVGGGLEQLLPISAPPAARLTTVYTWEFPATEGVRRLR